MNPEYANRIIQYRAKGQEVRIELYIVLKINLSFILSDILNADLQLIKGLTLNYKLADGTYPFQDKKTYVWSVIKVCLPREFKLQRRAIK